MASGPKRASERNDVPPSHGIPNTAQSTPSSVARFGRRANVRGPVKRGAASASGGWWIGDIVTSVTFARRGRLPARNQALGSREVRGSPDGRRGGRVGGGPWARPPRKAS